MSLLEKELAAVDKAATHAVDLVQSFAEQDPADPSSCWKNPSHMYEQLDQARFQALEAWKDLEQAKAAAAEADQGVVVSVVKEQQDLRAQFMDMVTDAFADVLAEMKDRENIDLDILVDCLQSGMEILSQEDKEFLMMEDSGVVVDDDMAPTPHEKRRQELGFQHVETAA